MDLRRPRKGRLAAILFLIAVTGIFIGDAQKCSHQPETLTAKKRLHVQRPQTSSRALNPADRMKFHVEYDQSILALSEAAALQDIVSEAVERVSKTFSVRQDPGYFLFPKECVTFGFTLQDGNEYCLLGTCYQPQCGEITVPDNLAQPCYLCDTNADVTEVFNCGSIGGVTPQTSALVEPVHFVLFVASLSTSCDTDTIGFASACYLDDVTDRPLAGFMNLCPSGLELDRERLLTLVQHEILHALGFSTGLYALYRDAAGNPLTARDPQTGLPEIDPTTGLYKWSDQVIRSIDLQWDHVGGSVQRTVQAFVLPNVLREARDHFGCPTLAGLELEDGGGAGSAMAHFEQRVLASEAMVASISSLRAFSRMTLALMEDTGWYIPDYDMADSLNWGKDLGCDFVQKSCKWWIDSKTASGESVLPWCNVPFEKGCHAEGVDAAECYLFAYAGDLPTEFQYFTAIEGVPSSSVASYGGIYFTDYCPYYLVDAHTPRNQTVNDKYCTNAEIVNDCRNSDCQNGGVCRDVVNGYYCECLAGYDGAFCEHANLECASNADCTVNEVCTASECVCVRDSIVGSDGTCSVVEVDEYSMTLTVTEVNGQTAVYDASSSNEAFINDMEYEIRQIIAADQSLSPGLVNVVTRSLYSGSIKADVSIMFNKDTNTTTQEVTEVMQKGVNDSSGVLSSSGTSFTLAPEPVVVQDANECEDAAGNDCSSNAQCTNTEGSYTCECMPGFNDVSPSKPGRVCTEINECSSDPCMHGGTCTDGLLSYQCTCAPGFQGTHCETNEDECDSDPCRHGSTCTDGANGYTCMCAPGYEGDHCQTDIDECGSNPCLNGATCNDQISGYNCTCADGFEGLACETDIEECDSSPCTNGGTCTSLDTLYRCECPSGYSGDQCQNEPVTCATDQSVCGIFKECTADGLCECKSGYAADENDECVVVYTFQCTMTINTLNGVSLVFTASLEDESSAEYQELYNTFYQLFRLRLRIIRTIRRIFFRRGSVVVDSDVGVAEQMTTAEVTNAIQDGLANGNISAGGSSIGLDPDTLTITDVNECEGNGSHDCSANAVCTNTEGSYHCSCLEGYNDDSPSQATPGRVCTKSGLSKGAIIAIAVCVFMVVVVFAYLLVTIFAMAQRDKTPPSYYPSSHTQQPYPPVFRHDKAHRTAPSANSYRDHYYQDPMRHTETGGRMIGTRGDQIRDYPYSISGTLQHEGRPRTYGPRLNQYSVNESGHLGYHGYSNGRQDEPRYHSVYERGVRGTMPIRGRQESSTNALTPNHSGRARDSSGRISRDKYPSYYSDGKAYMLHI